jgi:hypothetical protein
MLGISSAFIWTRTRKAATPGPASNQRISSRGEETVTLRRHFRRFAVLYETYCVQVNVSHSLFIY